MCLESDEEKVNRRINEQLKRDKKLARRDLKVLLLGTGESGKSTFMKQMFIIHNNGFTKQQLEAYRPYAFHNSIYFMQQLLKQLENFQYHISNPANIVNAQIVKNQQVTYENATKTFGPKSVLPREVVKAIQELWLDEGIKSVYAKRTEFELSDSAEYIFTNVHRFGTPGYCPSNEDMLRIRLPTTGISEHIFAMDDKVKLRIVDVGGQAGERKIWINCFECVQSIIFLAAINEYDSYMMENRQMVRRMSLSLDLFQVILSFPLLKNASMILFLNKHDLFCERLKISPLSRTFPEYDGNDNDIEAAEEFIKQLFLDRSPSTELKRNKSSRRDTITLPKRNSLVPMRSAVMIQTPEQAEKRPRAIYPHFTTATDTENIQIVFASIKHTIILGNIGEIVPGLFN